MVELTADSLFIGQKENGLRQGKGVEILPHSTFEGGWHHGQKKSGVQKTKSGEYWGEFQNNKKHGQGEFKWYNGESYSGQWY